MKIIIAGGRIVTSYETLVAAVQESGFKITQIVYSGHDAFSSLVVRYAEAHALELRKFPDDWVNDPAGMGSALVDLPPEIKNNLMSLYAEGVIAIWDGHSLGTKDMISQAQDKKLKVFVKYLGPLGYQQF